MRREERVRVQPNCLETDNFQGQFQFFTLKQYSGAKAAPAPRPCSAEISPGAAIIVNCAAINLTVAVILRSATIAVISRTIDYLAHMHPKGINKLILIVCLAI